MCVCVCLYQCVLLLCCPVASTHKTSNLVEELDGSKSHAVWCVVLGGYEGKALLEAFATGVCNHQWVHLIMQLLTHVEQGTATRGEHPLVEVACRKESRLSRNTCISLECMVQKFSKFNQNSQVADL